MSSNALYFPYINLPNNSWLIRTLLYWDQMSSIVPHDWSMNPRNLNQNMKELVDADLVRLVSPAMHIHQIPNFSEVFIEYIEKKYRHTTPRARLEARSTLRGIPSREQNKATQRPIRKESRPTSQIHQGKLPTSRIHLGKMRGITETLVNMGLAYQDSYPWFRVEEKIADEYMAYLAISLSRLAEIDAAPVTNQAASLKLITGENSRQYSHHKRKLVRELVLTGILPSPNQPVDIRDLVKFKEKHREKLSKFRDKIESVCIEISMHNDPEVMAEQIEYKIGEINDSAHEISSEMQSKWHRVSMGTLIPLIGAGISLVGAPTNPLSLTASGISLASATYQAFATEKKDLGVWQRPLAYAALAQTHFR